MVFVVNKGLFKNIALAMEKTIKASNKKYLTNHFTRFAFTQNGVLYASDGRKLIGIKTENLFPVAGAVVKDNTAYNFKLSNYNKYFFCIELEEVENIYISKIDNIINFETQNSFDFNFRQLEDWFAFNYRIGTFEIDHLKTAFDVMKYHGTVSYSNKREMKVESQYAIFVCIGRLTAGDCIKPKSMEDVLKEIECA